MAVTVTETEVTRRYRRYEVDFFGTTITTTVTSTPSVIRRWICFTAFLIRRRGFLHGVVGLGVQWRPRRGATAAALQICVGRKCLIVQLCRAKTVPNVLRRFLSNQDYTFTGIWNHSDKRRLMECEHKLEMARPPLDLRKHLETDDEESLELASFETIVEECLGYSGVGLEREISMSDWEKPVLSKKQVSQATVDAYVAFRLGADIDA